MVEASNSSRVLQATFPNSALTSFKKPTGLAIIFIVLLYLYLSTALRITGAAGLEPAVTVLETVGLPLTDAPIKLFRFLMRGMLMTGLTKLVYL